jgi:MSHA biogenesis protein MshG
MPSFQWTGRDAALASHSGIIESRSRSGVAQALASRGIVPIRIEPAEAPPEEASVTFSRWLRRDRIGSMELLMFSRHMHTLLRSGVPILRALQALLESTSHAGMQRMLTDLKNGLDSGLTLSQAMLKHPQVFDRFYVAMVRVGETSGRLTEAFDRLHEHTEFQLQMRNQVKAALRYPQFVLAAMAIALVVINIFVIPAFAKVFMGLKTPLPWMTRLLLASSKFMLHGWPFMAAGAGLTWWGARRSLAQPQGRLWWDRTKLRLPIAGPVLNKGALSRSCRGLATVLRSGVPVLEGLQLAATVAENAHIEQAVLGMRGAVERGESLLAAARKAGIFTPIVLQMIMVGEESGTLDEMLDEVGLLYQREVEYELKTMSQQIEPILILFLGGLVLVLALGVFLPMWDLGRASLK